MFIFSESLGWGYLHSRGKKRKKGEQASKMCLIFVFMNEWQSIATRKDSKKSNVT